MADTPVALAFHTLGIYGIAASGKSTRVSEWGQDLAQVAIPINDHELLLLHSMGMYKYDIRTHKSSSFGPADLGWDGAKCLLRCKRAPEHVLCLHSYGMYRISLKDGNYEKLSGGFLGMSAGWSEAKEVLYDPETDHHFVFHSMGIYKVDAKDGSYCSIGSSSGWHEAHGAVYHSTGAVVFHCDGTYKVNLKDGSYSNMGSHWMTIHTAVLADPDTALVFGNMGTYVVNLNTGESKTHGDWGWSWLACATNLGADVMAASHIEKK